MATKYFETKEQYITFRNAWAKAAQAKKLNASHMMLYNIIRGKDPQHGFTPFQRLSKIEGMNRLNRGASEAYDVLRRMQEQYIGSKYWHSWAEEFVAPFGDTFTVEDLKQIEIPKVEELWANFGKGLRIYKQLADGAKASTYSELIVLDVEEAA